MMRVPKAPSTPPMPKPKKPPLGITPRYIHDEARRQELGEAITRYIEAGLAISTDWVNEYNELIQRKKAVRL